ncbi:transposase [Chryseobacterium sp.]|uniref:transposase n=1 Tax=Chryseobacterium sp. TaxID=1871047 RepID=UPI0035C751A7
MNSNFKKIHIGQLIKSKVSEHEDITLDRICNFLDCDEEKIQMMYTSENLETDLLLKWSKLLKFDFFRLYSQHLILYSPPQKSVAKNSKNSTLPHFRKNIYTKEIIEFVLELIEKGEKDKQEIIDEYRIPKNTLYKWISKYS